MTDYAELVKRLREPDKKCDDCPDKDNYDACLLCIDSLFKETADAIEELQRKVEDYETRLELPPEAQYAIDKYADNLIARMDGMIKALDDKPKWIPVTERLPGEDCRVLAYYGFNHGDGYLGMMFMQVLDYYASDPRPHFQHEGLNGMTVTHWMPLSEPQKE